MARRPERLLLGGFVLCLLLQGIAILKGGFAANGDFPIPAWIPAVASLILAILLWRRIDSGRRGGLALATVAQILAIGLAAWSALATAGDDGSWAADRRASLAGTVAEISETVPRISAALDSLALRCDRLAADTGAFAMLQMVASQWPAIATATDRELFPLGLVLWKDGERIAWNGAVEPFPVVGRSVSGGGGSWGYVQRGGDGWYWRRFRPLHSLPGAQVLEMQLRLADPAPDPASPPPGWYMGGPIGRISVRAEIVAGRDLAVGGWLGDAQRGLSYTVGRELADGSISGEPASLRLSLDAPPRGLDTQRLAVRLSLGRQLLLAAALLGLAAATGSWWFILVAAWASRLLWVAADICHRLLPAFSGPRQPPGPADVSSLVDPTYFASRWGGGLYASTADALLTALIVALTAWVIGRKLLPVADGMEPVRVRLLRRSSLGVLFAVLASSMLLLLHDLAGEIVVNANARLIGPKVPFTFLTFWGLHLVLLLHAAATVTVLLPAAVRFRRGISGHTGLTVFIAALVIAIAVGTRVGPMARILIPILVVLMWRGTALFPSADISLKRLSYIIPLLIMVCWNYVALGSAYGRAELEWLESRVDEISRPQDDWVRFLMEDLLAEMAVVEPFPAAVPGAHAWAADELWQDWQAYALWRASGIDQLDLPCQIEVVGPDGELTSLFASGFFRDYGYEIGERSEWEEGEPAVPRPGDRQSIFLQTERRRFTDGDEWILRGEVARPGGEGWVRLELPRRSRRIRTLLDRLAGDEDATGLGGYLPRREVDRKLLLLRGGTDSWLDAGGGAVPDPVSAADVAALKAGEIPWSEIRIGGGNYRCLWRDLESGDGQGFLLGLAEPGLGDRLLDLSRLILLNLLLAAALAALPLLMRGWRRRSAGYALGFQEQFLLIYMILGLLPLLLAGTFVNRLGREWLAESSRTVTRDGIEAAGKQLQGLLAEQARALAASDYISDLLSSRLEGQRPLGPYGVRQGMLFAADGTLILDETLSDLDGGESSLLLDLVRASALVLMQDEGGTWLGTAVPVSLEGMSGTLAEPLGSDLAAAAPATVAEGTSPAPATAMRNGYFFYRQRVDSDLLIGLGDVVQGEISLSVAGEPIFASHPERVFSGQSPPLLSPAVMSGVIDQPGNTSLHQSPGRGLSWMGILSLPALQNDGGRLSKLELPATLAVTFPVRERDYIKQRERTVLFLAGLATLIFLTAMLLALALTWKIFDPVRVLVSATRRLAGGDYSAPLPEESGDELGTLSASFRAMRDDLNDAQQALADRERFLSSLLERVPVGVAVFDEAGREVSLNPAAAAILEDLYSGTDLAAAERSAHLLEEFRRRVQGGSGTAEILSWDERRTLRGRIAPLDLPGGRSDCMVVFEDVTEFLANKRLALNAQLARQVAHEVKNPLTPIQLSVQFLQQAWRDRAEDMDGILESTVRQVLEQVALLRSIATEFSLLGRPEDLECAPLDWLALARLAVGRYQQVTTAIGAGPEVKWLETEVPPVLAHAESLDKVLGNLMENSLQAVGDTSLLELEIGWRVSPSEVTMVWSDNGHGLAPDVADRLFNLYFSTKSQGTGLGLSICRNLLKKMKGRIDLRNREDGSGAVAEVTLPRADARSPEA